MSDPDQTQAPKPPLSAAAPVSTIHMEQTQRRLPELNEDVTGDILLRVPPDEPEHLVRASVVCKLWHRVVSDPAFLRRYAAFHRGAPLLGFFYNLYPRPRLPVNPGFVATTAVSSPPPPLPPPQPDGHSYRARWALDCRHGRVILGEFSTRNFAVWDPLSNHQDELQAPSGTWCSYLDHSNSSAVVLCAMAGCDHSSCRGGPFHVVCVGVQHCFGYNWVIAHVYSSESRTWSTTASAKLDDIKYFDMERAAVIGDGVYFSVNRGARILKYDLAERRFSTIISVPPYRYRYFSLMQNEDGSLGIAGVLGSRLYLWSTVVNVNPEGVTGWLKRRVIKLEEVLPLDIITTYVEANAISFAEGAEVFFISTNVGAFTFELKSGRVTKVGEPRDYRGVTPFISFFTPGCACSNWTKETLPRPN